MAVKRTESMLVLALAGLLTLTGCDKIPGMGAKSDDKESSDDDDDDDGNKKKKKKDDDDDAKADKGDDKPAATASAAATAAAPSGDSTGVAECDQYLAKLVSCFPHMKANADMMRNGYRQSAAMPQAKAAMAQGCTQSMTAIASCTPGAAGTPPAVPAVPAVGAAPTAAGASAGLPPSCQEFERVMNCMKSKAPPAQQGQIAASTKQVLDMVRPMGAAGEQACRQGLDQQKAVIAQVGCAAGGDAPPTAAGIVPPPAAAAAVTPGKEATPFINSKSAVPTTAEWDAQTKEVTVTGSSALNCETKMVREWLRVSCRGKAKGLGAIQNVIREFGGGKGDDFIFSSPGTVASFVVRYVPGTEQSVSFGWERGARRLQALWPRGAPEPESKGKFYSP
jgi:hypothetical protein